MIPNNTPTLTSNFDKQIHFILTNFDFERVHRVMSLLQWKWAGSDTTPSVKTLQQTARDLLRQVAESPYTSPVSVSCGGFRAVRYREPLSRVISEKEATIPTIVKLEFILQVGLPSTV